MPESISVAAFVVGLVLIVAALVGKPVKIAAVEVPDLNHFQRGVIGVLGLTLVVFGLLDGQSFSWPPPSPSPTNPSATSSPNLVNSPTSGECFVEVETAQQIKVAIEPAREVYTRFSSGQPHEDLFAVQVVVGGKAVGSVKFKSLASGSGFDILSVVDSACNPLTTYENATRPNQPQNAPYAFDTMRYDFGEAEVAIEIFYTDKGVLELRAQPITP